ncbi:MAG: hypothetical protein Q9168_005446 [Polycauliona sp. 1 TL-2023]
MDWCDLHDNIYAQANDRISVWASKNHHDQTQFGDVLLVTATPAKASVEMRKMVTVGEDAPAKPPKRVQEIMNLLTDSVGTTPISRGTSQANSGSQRTLPSAATSTSAYWPQTFKTNPPRNKISPLEHQALQLDTSNTITSLVEDSDNLRPVHISGKSISNASAREFTAASKSTVGSVYYSCQQDFKSRSQVRSQIGSATNHRFSTISAILPTSLTEAAEADAMDDAMDDAEFGEWLQSQNRPNSRVGRYADYQSASVSRISKPPARNLPVSRPFRKLASYKHNDVLLHLGVCAELREKTSSSGNGAAEDEEPHNSFMRIVHIIQDTRSKAVTLRGWIFQRASYLNGIMKKDRNEVCWVMQIDKDDRRDIKTQAMETVPVEDVIRRRRLILTNQPFPKFSFRDDPSCVTESRDVIRYGRLLVCRFQYICFYNSADRRDANAWVERVLQRLRAVDSDKQYAADDKDLRADWRGETVAGGAHASADVIDLTDDATGPAPKLSMASSHRTELHRTQAQVTESAMRVDRTSSNGANGLTVTGVRPAKRPRGTNNDMPSPQPKRHQISQATSRYERPPPTVSLLDTLRRQCPVREPALLTKKQPRAPKPDSHTKRQYTFNDYFCGAGGMSRAAFQNNLHIQDAFDFDKHACNCYHMNFAQARVHCIWAHEFVNLLHDYKCDIMHLSPTCKFFSSAHTREGKDDEMNTASWTALGELLKKSKPRVVTLEQTSGLVLLARHRGYLNALIQVFASHGFSIRWRLLHCADYGLPQMRLRLFMIASCPGEPLPPFPAPTHSSSPDTTGLLPWVTISDALATIHPNASHHNPHLSIVRALPPKSGDQLARTITCDGGAQVHPSGTRDYTDREFMTLNGFGPEHVFGSVGTKKQVGNAVPPIVGAKVLRSVVESMEKEDGIRRR